VTIGFETNPGIYRRLCEALKIKNNDMETLLRVLGVDYRGATPGYNGPDIFGPAPEGRAVHQTEGSIMRYIEHETGGYWDFCDFPLKDADDEKIASFPIPDADHFDYGGAADNIRAANGEFALYIGNPGMPDVINSNGRIMGMEDLLCHLITENKAALDFINRRAALNLNICERMLEKCKGQIDFMWLGEDLGTQIAPMISLDLYRRTIKPIHKKFCDLARAYNLPVMIHTCGSSSWAYEDMIEAGIRGVDTLQPEAADMSPGYLTKHFGGRLNFRGCISTAGALSYGTAEETERHCRETLGIMMPHRGYHFAPTHAIQDNTPVENVIAMYEAAHKYGRY
jgi:uroporphyrinogen decarboxylase